MKAYFTKLILILIIVAIVGGFVWYTFNTNPALRFGTDRAAVITQMQSLSRLETASFTIDKIIEAGTDYNSLNQILFGDKLLLIAHGEVIAGYDLSKLSPKDFSGAGKSITVTLPIPEIFSVRLDNEKTRVFDRDQGFLTKGNLNLEAEARMQAEQSIRVSACEGDILGTAEKNVKNQLEIIFKAAGFTEVTIVPVSSDVTLVCV